MSPATYAVDRRSAALRYTGGSAPRTADFTAQQGNADRQTPCDWIKRGGNVMTRKAGEVSNDGASING
jgi:hypothetical protein